MEDNALPARPNDIIGMPDVLNYLIRTSPVPDLPIVPGRLKLSTILPEKEWWRLYLNREDHPSAVSKIPLNPGSLYDTEKSPGFQESMLNAYRQVLDGDDFAALFNTATLTYDDYAQFYKLVTDKTTIKQRGPKDAIQFPIKPGIIAQDISTEIVLDRPLLADLNAKNPISCLLRANPAGAGLCLVYTKMGDSPNLINEAFRLFRAEIGQADRRRAQLHAIAKLIRFLHVLHTFSDGNGRLHVYFLLPRLLLQYGFGPPLRLGPCCSPDTLDGLFNGCFTLDQIVVFLWHAQQLPNATIEDLDLSKVK